MSLDETAQADDDHVHGAHRCKCQKCSEPRCTECVECCDKCDKWICVDSTCGSMVEECGVVRFLCDDCKAPPRSASGPKTCAHCKQTELLTTDSSSLVGGCEINRCGAYNCRRCGENCAHCNRFMCVWHCITLRQDGEAGSEEQYCTPCSAELLCKCLDSFDCRKCAERNGATEKQCMICYQAKRGQCNVTCIDCDKWQCRRLMSQCEACRTWQCTDTACSRGGRQRMKFYWCRRCRPLAPQILE